MFNIAICDDSPVDLLSIEKLVRECLMDESIHSVIKTFHSGKTLLASSIEFDVIFLDILLQGEHGVDIAQAIALKSPRARVVFVSNSSEFMQEGYKVNALRYITKSADQRILRQDINEVFRYLMSLEQEIWVGSNPSVSVKTSEVMYASKETRQMVFYLTGGVHIDDNRTLKQCEALLIPQHFVMVHLGILVNVRYIRNVMNGLVELKDGTRLPLSRRMNKSVKETFLTFIKARQ